MLLTDLQCLLSDYRKTLVANAALDERVILLEQYMKTVTEVANYTEFLTWLDEQYPGQSTKLFNLSLFVGKEIFLKNLFAAFRVDVAYTSRVARLSLVGIETKPTPKIVTPLRFTGLLNYVKFQSEQIAAEEKSYLALKAEVEPRANEANIKGAKIRMLQELDEPRRHLEHLKGQHLRTFLSSEDATSVMRTAKGFFRTIGEPLYWRDKLIEAGYDRPIILSLFHEGLIKNWANLHFRTQLLPRAYTKMILDPKVRRTNIKWRISCLSGEPKAIKAAYQCLTVDGYQHWVNDAILLATLSGNIAGIKLAISTTKALETQSIPSQRQGITGSYSLKPFHLIHGSGLENPLHYAVRSRSITALIYCIKELKIPPRTEINSGYNIMQIALTHAQVDMVKFIQETLQITTGSIMSSNLLPKPPFITEEKAIPGLHALYIALKHNSIETITEVLHSNPEVRSVLGPIALFHTFSGEKIENIRYAIETLHLSAEDLVALGVNPLLMSLKSGKLDNIKYVVEKLGIAVSTLIDKGERVLLLSCLSNSTDILRYMTDRMPAHMLHRQHPEMKQMLLLCLTLQNRRMRAVLTDISRKATQKLIQESSLDDILHNRIQQASFIAKDYDNDSATELANLLKTNTSLTTLSMSICRFDDDSFDILCDRLGERLLTLQEIHFEYNDLDKEHIATLRKLISSNKVKTLVLTGNDSLFKITKTENEPEEMEKEIRAIQQLREFANQHGVNLIGSYNADDEIVKPALIRMSRSL